MQRSLASLNITARPIHEATLAALYRKLEIRSYHDLEYIKGFIVPSGWQYTRHVRYTGDALTADRRTYHLDTCR